MAAKVEENPEFVAIKNEYIEFNMDVKIEPPDEPASPEPDYIPEIENVTVKIESAYCDSDTGKSFFHIKQLQTSLPPNTLVHCYMF